MTCNRTRRIISLIARKTPGAGNGERAFLFSGHIRRAGMNDASAHRAGRVIHPLTAFAAEVRALADMVDGARFRGSERYLIDADTLNRKLADLAERMRRAASERPPSGLDAAERIFAARTRFSEDGAALKRDLERSVIVAPAAAGRTGSTRLVEVERRRKRG